MQSQDHDLTALLIRTSAGDGKAIDGLMPKVYDELRRVALQHMRREGSGHTLQATALVHEAYMRLIDQSRVAWQNRAHFFAVSAQVIRRILIDHARGKHAAKRGSGEIALEYDEEMHGGSSPDSQTRLLALDCALEKLKALDERQALVVEYRYFGGLSIEETSEVLGTSPATTKRDWLVAKAWLARELSREQGEG